MQTGADTTAAATAVSRNTALQPSHEASPPGGPGLHLLWRDSKHGAIGENAPVEQAVTPAHALKLETAALDIAEDAIGYDQFRKLARSGVTFSDGAAVAHQARLDLQWIADGVPLRTSGSVGGAGQPASSPSPLMQSGVAALVGLSKLITGDVSDQDYAALLEDLRSHFGLPRSLQLDARWHFRSAARVPAVSHRDPDSLDRKVSVARYDSDWEWLRQTASIEPLADRGEYDYRRQSDGPIEAQNKSRRPRGSSA